MQNGVENETPRTGLVLVKFAAGNELRPSGGLAKARLLPGLGYIRGRPLCGPAVSNGLKGPFNGSEWPKTVFHFLPTVQALLLVNLGDVVMAAIG